MWHKGIKEKSRRRSHNVVDLLRFDCISCQSMCGGFEYHIFSNEYRVNLRFFLNFQMLISPVLAALAVAIGVPILLFYVYGVVPGECLIVVGYQLASSQHGLIII